MATTKINHPLITPYTEHQQLIEIIDIDLLQYDEDNLDLYQIDRANITYTDNEDYYEGLKTSIGRNGLFNPPVVYPNNVIKSGHTRTKIVRQLKHKTIPIIRSTVEKPQDSYNNKMALMMENQTRTTDIARQYRQIKLTIEAYEEEYKEDCPKNVIKNTICPAAQMSYNMFKQLRLLEEERSTAVSGIPNDLFDRVVNTNGAALSPGKAHELRLKDKNKPPVSPLPISNTMKKIVTEEDIVYAVNFVNNAMNQLRNINGISPNQEYIPAFENIQQNVIGGLAHETFTNAVTDSINHRNPKGTSEPAVARASKSQRIEDIFFPTINGAIEVKTCLIKDGNKLKFTTGKVKTGFYLLVGFTDEFDYVYCSYGFLDDTAWKRGYHGPATMDITKLQKANMNNLAGTLKLDKKTEKVHCIPVSIESLI